MNKLNPFFHTIYEEISKAYRYFDDPENYVLKVQSFCIEKVDEYFIKHKKIKEIKLIIEEFQNTFSSEVEKLFVLRLFNDFVSNQYIVRDFLNLRILHNSFNITFLKKIRTYMAINDLTIIDPDYKLPNGLSWSIVGIFDDPSDAIINILSEGVEKTNLDMAKNQPAKSNRFLIDWTANERTIPYLFYLLNQYGFIHEKNLFSLISKHFTVNGKSIDRVNLINNYKQADFENKNINELPKEIRDINTIVDRISELEKILKAIDNKNL